LAIYGDQVLERQRVMSFRAAAEND